MRLRDLAANATRNVWEGPEGIGPVIESGKTLVALAPDMAIKGSDLAEQLATWLDYIEEHTEESTSYSREVLAAWHELDQRT